MCYSTQSRSTSSGDGQFHYKNDDYWDPGATTSGSPSRLTDKVRDRRGRPFWAVNLNQYVCPLATVVNGTVTGTSGCSRPNDNPGYQALSPYSVRSVLCNEVTERATGGDPAWFDGTTR